jgi:hypothetical protein
MPFNYHLKSVKMKHTHFLASLLITSLTCASLVSCSKKSDDPTPSNPAGNNSGIAAVPATFTQKVLIEQFTGAWNGGCPDGLYRMDQLITNGNSKVIGVNIHMGDAMETTQFNSYIAIFNNNNLPQFPSAMVNRIPSLGNVILSKTQWASNATLDLAKTAGCGLAIKSTVSGNSASVEVHAGFKSALSGTYNLTVYLIENKVSGSGAGYDQVNTNATNDPNSPYYNKPTPMAGFEHNNVIRKVVSADMGDIIDPSEIAAGGEFIKTYSVDITGKSVSNLRIIAFINKPGVSSTTHEIMNVQQSDLNTTKDWD